MGNHPTSKFVSTHPVFFSKRRYCGLNYCPNPSFEEIPYIDDDKRYTLEIGNDVFIGQGAIILNGLRIGDGAIIGAGAVVTKDVPPFAIVVGCPSHVVNYRFSHEQIENVIKTRWWDWDENQLEKRAAFFDNIEAFIEKK